MGRLTAVPPSCFQVSMPKATTNSNRSGSVMMSWRASHSAENRSCTRLSAAYPGRHFERDAS